MKRILAIGAHPDDIELGCSGFLQKGELIHMVVLSRGEKGSKINRAIEARDASTVLGSTLSIYELLDTEIKIQDIIPLLEREIILFQPDIVLTMAANDTHQDHRSTFEATKVAVRKTQCTLLSYMSPSSAEYFHPTWFTTFTEDQMKVKLEAIACHKSQLKNNYLSEEYVRGISRYWAMVTKSNVLYVEPFEVIQHWS